MYFKERSHVNLLSSWMRFLTYDICLYDISKHLWFYTPCNTHSIGNLDAQYGQLQHGGICRSSSWRSFGKPGSARVLLLLLSPAPSSRRSGRPALGERKSSRGLIGCSALLIVFRFSIIMHSINVVPESISCFGVFSTQVTRNTRKFYVC